jgi:hypothetical protein
LAANLENQGKELVIVIVISIAVDLEASNQG